MIGITSGKSAKSPMFNSLSLPICDTPNYHLKLENSPPPGKKRLHFLNCSSYKAKGWLQHNGTFTTVYITSSSLI